MSLSYKLFDLSLRSIEKRTFVFGGNSYIEPKMIKAEGQAFPIRTISSAHYSLRKIEFQGGFAF